MRGTVLRVLPALVLVIATTAQAVTFYLHESGSPVSVPGGTTTFVLDENPPVAATPVAESVSVSKNDDRDLFHLHRAGRSPPLPRWASTSMW